MPRGQKLPRFFRLFRLFRLFLEQNFEDVFVGFLSHFCLENAPQIQFKFAFFSTFWHVLFRGGLGNARNVKISVLPTPYAHFRRFKGSQIHSKNSSKITKNLEKNMPGNAMFLVFVFLRFFLDFVTIWGHFGAPKATWEPSKSSFFRTWLQDGL